VTKLRITAGRFSGSIALGKISASTPYQSCAGFMFVQMDCSTSDTTLGVVDGQAPERSDL
jgi:hypothetical protein